MELKKVTNQTNRNYAKKNQITKKDLKSSTPNKWIVAASTGIVTLFYTSPKKSIHQIGVVFGCIEMAVNYNYSPLFNTLNSIMDFFYYSTWIAGFVFIISLLIGIFTAQNEESNEKMKVIVKKLLSITIILAIITAVLVFILGLDISAFYVGGIKKKI